MLPEPRPNVDLRAVPMFSRLTPEDLTAISAGCRRLTLGKNEVLFYRGQASHGFFFLEAGQVQLAVSSTDGAEKVLEIIGAGETFGEAVLFAEKPYPVTAKALLRTDVLSIGKGAIFDMLDRDPRFARRVLASMAQRQHQLVHDVEAYCLRSATQRVVGFLLREVNEGDLGTTVVLPTHKHVLASRLSITPESLSRVLRGLSEAGLIAVDGPRITLHSVARLERELGWT